MGSISVTMKEDPPQHAVSAPLQAGGLSRRILDSRRVWARGLLSSKFALHGWRAVAESATTGRSSSEMAIPGFRVKPGVKEGSDIQRGRAGPLLEAAMEPTQPAGWTVRVDA